MKKSAKQSIDKWHTAFAQYRKVGPEQFAKFSNDFDSAIFSLFNIINYSDSSKIREIEKINEMIYRDPIIKEMLQIIPYCTQSVLNTISGFFQVGLLKFPNNSIATYFIKHREAFNNFILLFDNLEVESTVHIIFRNCLLRSRQFAEFIFQNGFAIYFVQCLVDDNFGNTSSAFVTFDIFLNSYIDLSLEYITKNWNFFRFQFQFLLNSTDDIKLEYFLPIFYNFLNNRDSKSLLRKFIDDPDNLIIIMNLFKSKKRRLSVGAYYIFKLFVMNARRSKYTFSTIKQNKKKIIKLLNHFVLPDRPSIQEQLEEEHQFVIKEINKM